MLHTAAKKQLDQLFERKRRLVEAFVYERAIDKPTYQTQLDKLDEDIALAEIRECDARIEDLDVEAAVRFGELILRNAPALWLESNLDQKQRLQSALSPAGLSFTGTGYRTNQTSLVFYHLQQNSAEQEGLVALPGIEPGFAASRVHAQNL